MLPLAMVDRKFGLARGSDLKRRNQKSLTAIPIMKLSLSGDPEAAPNRSCCACTQNYPKSPEAARERSQIGFHHNCGFFTGRVPHELQVRSGCGDRPPSGCEIRKAVYPETLLSKTYNGLTKP